MRFRRVLNLPLALGLVAVVVVLVVATITQGRAITRADDAVAESLTTADLVAQARAAAYDSVSQEALTLINRGNGQANEDAWLDAAAVVDASLVAACDRGSSDACTLQQPWSEYVSGHEEIRRLDDGGDWDSAVAVSLGAPYGDSTLSGDQLKVTTVPFAAFASASQTLVEVSAGAATSALSAATDGLALMRVLVFLVGLLVIVLAVVGFGQRLREYR